MAKSKQNYDADYDRWGRAPGSIKVTKPEGKTVKSTPKKTPKKKS